MNFIIFSASATNIFPLANSHEGGQLLTEFNLRSRESIATDPAVEYMIGPSYTHSERDWALKCTKDDPAIGASSILITPGRGLVNGHFIESLSDIIIDMAQGNLDAQKAGEQPLKGKLVIGLRMMYSTYVTTSGAAVAENSEGYYEGIQVVVLPEGKEILPSMVPKEADQKKVNMHLVLGHALLRNGSIISVTQNKDKWKSLDGRRLQNIDELLSSKYISKKGLNPNKIYTFAGKNHEPSETWDDYWCDSTDSLMVWDSAPRIDFDKPSLESKFLYNDRTGKVDLVMPHKQIDGMKNTAGKTVYLQDKVISLPVADFDGDTGGTITKQYTERIKYIRDKIDNFYRLPNGHMKAYIPILSDRNQLPKIPMTTAIGYPNSSEECLSYMNAIRADLAVVQQDVASLKAEISQKIKAEIDNLGTNTINQLIQSQLGSTADSLNNILNSISDIERRLASLEVSEKDDQGINQLKVAVTNLQSNVKQLQTDMSKLKAQQAAYESTTTRNINKYMNEKVDEQLAKVTTALANLDRTLNAFLKSTKRELEDEVRALATKYNVSDEWTWRPGDYVLVGQDQTVSEGVEGRAPSTMYVVGPGHIKFISKVDTIETVISLHGGTSDPAYQAAYRQMLKNVPSKLAGGVEIADYNIESEDQLSSTIAKNGQFWEVSAYKGTVGKDYFVARYRESLDEGKREKWTCIYYTPTMLINDLEYLDPIWVTGGVPYATETAVGGFLNTPKDATGNGYVRRTEDGRLQLIDYDLLLTGVLAYQLGEDRSEGSGLPIKDIQGILEENINDRVVFPNASQYAACKASGADPTVIHLYLHLPKDPGELIIHDIGSRYGSSLHVHISGEATSATTLRFINCDKLRIDSNISGAPTIHLDKVNLYYDADVIDRIKYISRLTIWYERYTNTDPDLQVDGMTVRLLGKIESSDYDDPWTTTYVNDNHYAYSLRSLTLSSYGEVIALGLICGDSTTANIDEGKSVFAGEFVVPQSIGLNYPPSKMTKQIKITGSFVSHYRVVDGYMMKHTEFTALTHKQNPKLGHNVVKGTISFYTDATVVSSIGGIDPGKDVDGWRSGDFHLFYGGAIE